MIRPFVPEQVEEVRIHAAAVVQDVDDLGVKVLGCVATGSVEIRRGEICTCREFSQDPGLELGGLELLLEEGKEIPETRLRVRTLSEEGKHHVLTITSDEVGILDAECQQGGKVLVGIQHGQAIAGFIWMAGSRSP